MAAEETGRMSRRNRAFLNNRKERPGPHRAMVAAASPLKLADKSEARRMRVLRQGWQEDAMSYVDALPELNFAYRFQTNSASRMRWYPAMTNPEDPAGPPIPFDEADVADRPPQEVQDICSQALGALGTGGRQAVRPIQESLRWNMGVPGECFVVGTEGDDGSQEWKIRSIDEFVVYEDQYKMRDVPLDPQGILGWIDVDPAKTYAARLWAPHPRFQKLSTSPMRALLDVAEELLLLSRDVRATARSRLAGAGILKIPEGLRMMSFLEDNSGDAMSDEWFGKFAEAMLTPIADEGVASAVVPIAVSGEAQALAGLDHMLIERPYSALAMELRAEAIGRLATGVDVPREVLEGMSDPNHWGAWLVSDDTFRHHLEPQVITQVDCFSVGYLRPWLQAASVPQFWLDRLCIWYDPTELITKPDPAANAVLAWDRMSISNHALAEALGFNEDDMPSALEVEIRMITKLRSFPPNVVEALLHELNPALEIPPIGQSGTVPGMGPKGAIPVPPPGITAPGAPPTEPPATSDHGPATPTGGAPTPTATTPPAPPGGTPALPPAPTGTTATPEPFAAQGQPQGPTATEQRLSRRLSEIDRDVRIRVHQAACAAMMRLIDRAGAKLRTKASDRRFGKAYGAGQPVGDLRGAIKDAPNRRVAAVLGREAVTALGYGTSMALLDPGWEELEGQFNAWVRAAQLQSVRTACKLAKVDPAGPRARDAEGKLAAALPPAWEAFKAALNARAENLLYNPDPNADEELSVNPNTVVPTGVVRQALSIAGGAEAKPITAADVSEMTIADVYPTGTEEDKSNVEGETSGEGHVLTDIPDGQIGTGAAVGGLLDASGMEVASFTWAHGPSLNPFEPHLDLDGTEFTNFNDDALANPGDFPEVDFFFPGDHIGCSCDFATVWTQGGDEGAAPEEDAGAAEDTGGEDAGGFDLSSLADQIGNWINDTDAQDATIEQWAQIGGHLEADDNTMAMLESAVTDQGSASKVPLFRGTSMDEDELRRSGMENVGRQVNVPIASASPQYDTAIAYAESGDKDVQVVIEYPKGTRALDIEDKAAVPEGENLVQGKFTVASAERDEEGTLQVRLEKASGQVNHSDAYRAAQRQAEALAQAVEDGGGFSIDLSGLNLSDWSQSLVDQLTGDAGPDSQAAAWRDLDAAKQSVMDEVTQARVDAEEVLNRMGVPDGIARPGRTDTSAEYDWYRSLHTSERDRLRNNGWVSGASRIAPDQAALASHESVEAAMSEFLDATRTIDAARLIEGGRALSANIESRFGGWEFDNLAPTSPYKIDVLFGERTAAADYVASQRSELAAEQIGRVFTGNYGQPIYNMSFSDYQDEVLSLTDELADATPVSSDDEFGEVYSQADQAAYNRLYELLPDELMPPGDAEPDLQAIWAEATQMARLAGLGAVA